MKCGELFRGSSLADTLAPAAANQVDHHRDQQHDPHKERLPLRANVEQSLLEEGELSF